jgi:hypothetical protein
MGQVLPAAARCDGVDHACVGRIDVGCVCQIGDARPCYDGPIGTEGVGVCHGGMQRCVMQAVGFGSMWGACEGEVLPGDPQCDGLDHACSGMLPDCRLRVMCSPPLTTPAGQAIRIEASATPTTGTMLVSEHFTITQAPTGAVDSVMPTDASPTFFMADQNGHYVVRYTATDSTGNSASCDVPIDVMDTYRGTEFWAVGTANSPISRDFDFAVAIGNHNPTDVTVTVSGGALSAPMMFTVPARRSVTQVLPWVDDVVHRFSMGAFSGLTPHGAYRITATLPVSAYQFNPLQYVVGMNYSYSNDASLLLPTGSLTGNYLVLSHNAWYRLGGFAAIVGTQPTPTRVTVQLRSAIVAGPGVTAAASGTTQTYMLQRGDVLQLVSTASDGAICTLPTPDNCPYDVEDLTGTVVSASAPVAVFAGNDCAHVSFGDGRCRACDHMEQQLFPVESWGRDVVVAQFQDRGPTEPFMTRVLARDDGTMVTFTPASVHAPVTLQRGQFVEFCSARDFEVTSSAPILVGKFQVGEDMVSCDTCSLGGMLGMGGDPSFALGVPTAQFRSDYDFVVPGTYMASFISVVAHAGAMIQLDGRPLMGPATPLMGTTWAVWREPVFAGPHEIESMDHSGFGLEVLGDAPYTSYVYPGGLDLNVMR